jgi:hypothetical protein
MKKARLFEQKTLLDLVLFQIRFLWKNNLGDEKSKGIIPKMFKVTNRLTRINSK